MDASTHMLLQLMDKFAADKYNSVALRPNRPEWLGHVNTMKAILAVEDDHQVSVFIFMRYATCKHL